MEHFVSLDVGTTAIKVSLVGRTGRVTGLVRREYELDTPSSDIVELDATRYWSYAREGIRRLVSEAGIPKSEILSIAISSQGETLVPVDRKGTPLRKAIVWLDNRSRQECKEIRDAFGLIRETGQNEVIPTWPATRLLWLKNHETELFERTHKFLLLEDFLLFHLTGTFVGEYSLYTSSYLLDIVKREWISEMLDLVGVRREQLATLCEPGSVIGRILPSVAEDLSLSDSTLVVAGAMDQAASVVGAGGVTEDITVETTGTVLSVCKTLDAFDEQAHRGHPVHYHAVAGKYHTIDWCPTGGKSLGWLRELLSADGGGATDFDDLTAPAAGVEPGSEGLKFFPFLSGLGTYGPVTEAHGAFLDIEIHHTSAHFVRSVMES
ncbi:MAG TPA: FGGY family carbohydrate kinase, partial [Spirochaetia bacterium]|nr:FGGY family carbohydrate kinase [Spirochaetia bacterium]